MLRSLAFAAALVLPSLALAGNGDAVPVSNEAALMGQAAVANGTGAAAMYYNPALLGRLEQSRADVTGSAFHLRISESQDLLIADDATIRVRNTEIVSIPSALAYARPIGDDWRIGFGVFSPIAQDLELRVAETLVEGESEGSLRITLLDETAVYVGVLSVARRLQPGLWLGAALNGIYSQSNQNYFQTGRLSDPTGSLVVGIEQQTELAFGGVSAQLGLTWEASPRVTLAGTITSPILALAVVGSVRGVEGFGGGGTDGGGSSLEPFRVDLPPARVGPIDGVGFRAGAEIRPTPALRLALDGEVRTRMRNADLGVDVDAFWNLRVGLEGRVAEEFWLAGGLFTDRQGNKGIEDFAVAQIDFWGFTAGARWQTGYRLAEDEERDRVTFGSVLAFRYAYGRGNVGGIRADLQATNDADALTLHLAELRQHELGVHIGAWTAF
ncbi:MAG: hypothetical protein AAGH15_03520 [Myxococcota bacterium]